MPAQASERAGAQARRYGLTAAALVAGAIGYLLWAQFDETQQARAAVQHTYEVLGAAKDLQIAMQEAESSQRGFLLTGQDDYLRPYQAALDRVTLLDADLRRLTADNPAQQARLQTMDLLVKQKLELLAQTIRLRREAGLETALRLVQTDLGRQLMEEVESQLSDAAGEERRLLTRRIADADRAFVRDRWLALAVLAVAFVLLVLAGRRIVVARDELASAEAAQRALVNQFRTSLDSISQGIGVFSPEHRLLHWNPCFPVLLAIPEASLHEGLTYATVVAVASEVAGGTPFLETEDDVHHGRPAREPAVPVVYERTRPTDRRTFEFRRTAMPGGGFVLTLTDITERARAEATARDTQRLQAMGQLTGGIAHDFNNLLAVVLGNLELVQRKMEPGDPSLPRVERAMWGARRGAALTQQLLAFARSQPLAPAPVDLSAMLSEMANLLRRTLGERIDVQVGDAVGLWPAMADATQVESALLNLALNARDAMPDGGRLTIEVANKVLDADYAARHAEVTAGDYVMLAVSDTGTGMPPEILARAFEPFFTTKGPGKGTGLGLAMVFGFAKQSRGHVNIYSEPGHGTTVRLYLPRAAASGVHAAQREDSPVELPRGTATVLVVEDDAAVREITVAMLRDLGYRVLAAADGAEALQVRDEAGPSGIDLLLTDVVLPGPVKGHELARQMTNASPNLCVLFVSGYTENAIVHQGRLDEGVHLLGKPFSREALARKVATILSG